MKYFSIILLFFSCCNLIIAGDKTDAIRKEVKGEKPKKIIKRDNPSKIILENEIDDFGWFGICFSIFDGSLFRVIGFPWYSPYNEIDRGSGAEFMYHPYQYKGSGYLNWDSTVKTKPIAIEARTEYKFLNDDLSSFDTQLLFSTNVRFDLKYNWHVYKDESEPNDLEHFHIHNAMVLIRFAQTERIQFRSGFGLNWIVGENDLNDAGFNFSYGVDFYPIKPLAGSVNIDLGSLGDAFYFRTKIEMGAYLKNFELNFSFDYIEIGEEQIYGPGIGIRLSF